MLHNTTAHLSTLVKGQRKKSKLYTRKPTHSAVKSYGYVNSSGQIPYWEANIRPTSQENYGSRMFITVYTTAHQSLLRHGIQPKATYTYTVPLNPI
jgi:hypothetical protein